MKAWIILTGFLSLPTYASTISVSPADLSTYRNKPHRYAHFVETRIPLSVWSVSRSGERLVYSKQIDAPGAVSLSFFAEPVELPGGARLTVTNRVGQSIVYTAGDFHGGRLLTDALRGDSLSLSIDVAEKDAGDLQFEIAEVQYGFREVLGINAPGPSEAHPETPKNGAPTGNGGTPQSFPNTPEACNRNHACFKTSATAIDGDSAVLLNLNGGIICSSQLVMNSARDFKPYVLTARHCIEDLTADQVSRTTFLWKAEAACASTKYNEAGAGVALRTDGGKLRFKYGDVALLESDFPPPKGANPYWLGVDASRDGKTCNSAGECSLPANARVDMIHHAQNRPRSAAYNSRQVTNAQVQPLFPESRNQYQVPSVWNQTGALSEGASGTSLIYRGRTIGVGSTIETGKSCSESYQGEQITYFERLMDVWNNSAAPGGGLKSFLDPRNTGALMLDGSRDPARAGAPDVSLTLSPSSIEQGSSSSALARSAKGMNCEVSSDLGGTKPVEPNNSVILTGSRVGEFPVKLKCLGEDGTPAETTAVLSVRQKAAPAPSPASAPAASAAGGGGALGWSVLLMAAFGARRRGFVF